MSYSFSVQAATKEEAKTMIKREFDQVVSGQPPHAKDRAAAEASAGAMIDVLRDPQDGEVIKVSVHGSVSWTAVGAFKESDDLISAGVGVSASIGPA